MRNGNLHYSTDFGRTIFRLDNKTDLLSFVINNPSDTLIPDELCVKYKINFQMVTSILDEELNTPKKFNSRFGEEFKNEYIKQMTEMTVNAESNESKSEVEQSAIADS